MKMPHESGAFWFVGATMMVELFDSFFIGLPMLSIHPISERFAKLNDKDYASLKRDIARFGQKRPIALYEGMVWDGRARLQACYELGLQPKVRVLKRKDQPVAYLLKRHGRYGEPHSKERNAALDILWQVDEEERIASSRRRRAEWLRAARNEFKADFFLKAHVCEVCNKHAEFAHAHHSLPLGVQYEMGLEYPAHEINWLCPTHHRYVHMLISVYITDTRSGDFLDRIADDRVDEWLNVERVFGKSLDLFKKFGGMHQNGRGNDYDWY